MGDSRSTPPLVDEDWHAFCQVIHKGVSQGSGMGELCAPSFHKHKEGNQ